TILLIRTAQLPGPEVDTPNKVPHVIDAQRAAARLGQAITLQTISHSHEGPVAADAFVQLHQFLAQTYPKAHTTLTRETVNDFSLLYTWKGSDPSAPPIALLAHLDVVPSPNLDAWEQPPYAGRVVDGFIWGRGALDDKCSVLAILEATEVLIDAGFAPKRTIYFAFGHDEELSGHGGAQAMAKLFAERNIQLDYVLDEGSIVIEGAMPGVHAPVALIGVAEKGFATLELTAKADGGHSSMPPKGGVIARLAQALDRLEHHPLPGSLAPPVDRMLTQLAPHMPFAMRMVMANQWLFEPLLVRIFADAHNSNAMIRTTTALTVFQGGVKANVLPRDARALLNFRILPGESVADVVSHVETVIDDPDVAIRVVDGHEPVAVSSTESAGYRAISTATRQVFPEAAVAPSLVIAATDSHHYVDVATDLYRFLPIHMQPSDLDRLHGVNERIGVEQYGRMIDFYAQLLHLSAG
ncbi:MAG: M20 family peptidase, partial [Nannocystaceae bacterium]